ncbi:hypothetical protein [Pasteuria penetrans]|uniref:hypothetical protein n=1 Tax=Pasteuria penetrans TaxID=86005 RepID=UPI000FBD9E99|nr:hypothetical protein [Pasteuria penetrans]
MKMKISKKLFCGLAPLFLATIVFTSGLGVEAAPVSHAMGSTTGTASVSPNGVDLEGAVPTLSDEGGSGMELQRSKRAWNEDCGRNIIVGAAVGGLFGLLTGPVTPLVVPIGMLGGATSSVISTCMD